MDVSSDRVPRPLSSGESARNVIFPAPSSQRQNLLQPQLEEIAEEEEVEEVEVTEDELARAVKRMRARNTTSGPE